MKNLITILMFICSISTASAHYIWVETANKGTINEKHMIKIRFGEYSYDEIEKTNGDKFKSVKDFTVWVISPNGKKEILTTTAKVDYYQASFIPKKNGTYTIALDNKKMHVLDFTKYDYTVFKPQYHAKAKVVVGKKLNAIKETNTNSIEIIDESKTAFSKNNNVELKVLYKGKPLVDNEVSIFMKDGFLRKKNG